jgi:transcriptional regulator with XRE-family HTH domain
MLDPHKVKAWRTRRDMTQAEVAAAIAKYLGQKNFSVLTVNHFENPTRRANPTLATIEGMASAFGCKVQDLISEGDADSREKAKPLSDPEKNPEAVLRRRARERDRSVAAAGRVLEKVLATRDDVQEQFDKLSAQLKELQRGHEAIGAEE